MMNRLFLLLAGLLPVLTLGATLSATEIATLQAGGSIALQGPAIVVAPPPPPPPPATAASFTLYADGVFAWPGDYSYSLKANYKDTSGKPTTGTYDIACSLTGQWGGWQPYAPGWVFDITPYTFLQFDAKTTVANQQWNVFALQVGDVNITDVNGHGISVDLNNYGPTPGKAPVVGAWVHYKIPLALFMTHKGVLLKAMYKFDIHDETGLSVNTWYVNNVKFTAN